MIRVTGVLARDSRRGSYGPRLTFCRFTSRTSLKPPKLQIPTPQALIRQAQQLSSQCAPFEQTHQEQAADARRTTSVWVGNVCATQQASNVATMLCVAKVVGGRAAKLCSIHSHTLEHAAWLSMPCSRRRAACVAARTQSVPMSHLPEMQCEASHVLR